MEFEVPALRTVTGRIAQFSGLTFLDTGCRLYAAVWKPYVFLDNPAENFGRRPGWDSFQKQP